MFEMLKEVQRMSIQQTVASEQVLQNVEAQFVNLHERFIPEHVQKGLDKGIAAVQHHKDRATQIEEKENVDREVVGNVLNSQCLSDLDAWENCVTSTVPAAEN